ncbi:hypothetical protein [Paraburkholderia megapolitana]|uniref:hypothetical protein n=1 Tax=Paraburkholderia megapolitana TaxID=420953 RepID=UPI001478235E|nr:hypothetical protein [Paraburkholderia megapolitana]
MVLSIGNGLLVFTTGEAMRSDGRHTTLFAQGERFDRRTSVEEGSGSSSEDALATRS